MFHDLKIRSHKMFHKVVLYYIIIFRSSLPTLVASVTPVIVDKLSAFHHGSDWCSSKKLFNRFEYFEYLLVVGCGIKSVNIYVQKSWWNVEKYIHYYWVTKVTRVGMEDRKRIEVSRLLIIWSNCKITLQANSSHT